jgi:hypothetical protein
MRLSLRRFLLARAHPSHKVEAAGDPVVAVGTQAVEARLLAQRPGPELLAHLLRQAKGAAPATNSAEQATRNSGAAGLSRSSPAVGTNSLNSTNTRVSPAAPASTSAEQAARNKGAAK